MDQLLSESINFPWQLLSPLALFADPRSASLACLPTYQQLECRSGSPWFCSDVLWSVLVTGQVFIVLGIVQSLLEGQCVWADGKGAHLIAKVFPILLCLECGSSTGHFGKLRDRKSVV